MFLLLWCTGLEKYFNRHSTPPKKKLFLPTVLVMDGTWKKFHRYSIATEKKLFIATVPTTKLRRTQKLSFGIILLFNEKHLDPISLPQMLAVRKLITSKSGAPITTPILLESGRRPKKISALEEYGTGSWSTTF